MIGASIVIRVSCTVITHRISGKHHGVMIFFRVSFMWGALDIKKPGAHAYTKSQRHAPCVPSTSRARPSSRCSPAYSPTRSQRSQLFFVISVVVEPLCFHFSPSRSISLLRYLPLKLYTYLTLQTQVLPFNKLTPGGCH